MFPKGFDHLPMYQEYCVQFKTQMQKAYSVLKSFTHTQKVLIQLWWRYQAIFLSESTSHIILQAYH